MQMHTAKEQAPLPALFPKKESPRLIPYSGSPRQLRLKAGRPTTSKKQLPRQRRQLSADIRRWFAAEIAVWPHDPNFP